MNNLEKYYQKKEIYDTLAKILNILNDENETIQISTLNTLTLVNEEKLFSRYKNLLINANQCFLKI
jgi:vesicle coat complex subunit